MKIKKYKNAKDKFDAYYSIKQYLDHKNFEKAREYFQNYYSHITKKELDNIFCEIIINI